ncbi:MAG TPA: hypothetical protein VI757_02960 [Bacteroidia bacterium]|nr:hypothetical protein [Bacteroidia bacterium]
MNRNLFLQMLAHPDSVSEAENIALKKFTEDFPYCQTGQMLFVKHLHSEGSVHYPEQLKVAAAYAADRKVLYHLVHSLQKEVEVAAEQIPHRQPLSLRRGERTEESSVHIPEVIIPEKKVTEESISLLDIIQKRLEEIAASPPAPLQGRVESAPNEPEVVPVKEAEKVPEPKIVLQTEEPKQKEIVREKKEEVLKSDKHSFTEWLKTIKKEPTAEHKEEEKPLTTSSTDEIINRFIETEPRIVPSKAEFYSPVKMAKQSLEEHDDLVSETLAGIFANQGNLKRAIEMYKKLMLANPEKSTFFAALIEKLTQQLKEGK